MAELLPIIKNKILTSPPFPPCSRDLLQHLYESLAENKDVVFLTNAATGAVKTGNDILEEVYNLSVNLREELGIKPGDSVVLISENCVETPILTMAIWKLGAIFAPINPVSTIDELLHILSIIKPKIIVCSENVVSKVQETSLKLPSVERIVLYGDAQSERSFNSLLRKRDEEENEVRKAWSIPVSLDSVGSILCSSGTTGLPKCVELTYNNLFYGIFTFNYYHKEPKRVTVSGNLPLFHGFGIIVLFGALLRKDNFILFQRFEISTYLKAIEKYKINTLYVVPPIMVLLAKHPFVDQVDLSSVRDIRFGAAPIRAEVIDAVRERVPKSVAFNQGYGLTETSVCAALCVNVLPVPPGSVGLPSLGWETKIIDVETQEPLGPNEKGELCFRGCLVMKGYKDNPEATAATIDADGWLHTGDVGYYNEDGWLFVQERIKELIKYNAYQVSPTEIEAILIQNSAVKDVAVWGQPNDEHGELPMAFVVLQPEMSATEKELQDFVAERVSPYKKLRGGVQFVDEIPKSQAGKIIRRKLPEIYIKQK